MKAVKFICSAGFSNVTLEKSCFSGDINTLCLSSTVCKEPPYKVEESGYAGFLMPIEVYFKNKVRQSDCDAGESKLLLFCSQSRMVVVSFPVITCKFSTFFTLS